MSKAIPKKQTTPLKQTTPNKSPITSPVDSASNLSSRKPSISKSTIKMESCGSKASIFDKSIRTEPSIAQRLTPKLLVENLLGGLTSENSLDFNILLANEHMQVQTLTELQQIDTNRDKTGDELTDLKEELRLKNLLIEKLTKENLGLRKEVGAFLAITDKIQTNLDEERRSYEVRIAALEQENNDLLAENKFYKDQTHRRFRHRMSMDQLPTASSLVLNERSDQDENFNTTKWGSVKDFHSNVQEKMVTFDFTKEDLRKSTQYCNTERDHIKENTPSTCRSLKREERTPKKPLFSNRDKLKTISPLTRSQGVLSASRAARASMTNLHRGGHNSDSKVALETTIDKRANVSVSKFKI